MERFERYNQFLAVAGRTLAILFLLFLVLYFLLQVLGFSFKRGPSESPAGIVSGEEAARLAQDSVRRQVVSFNKLEILDSARQWYLLPVGQARLEKEEYYGLTNALDYESRHGLPPATYNNMQFYDGMNGRLKTLFDRRVSINRYLLRPNDAEIRVLLWITYTDSNRDDYLDGNDLESLAVFHPATQTLVPVETPGRTFLGLEFPHAESWILHYGLDHDQDGTFQPGQEPKAYYRLDLKDMELREIVPEPAIEQLQRRLDGH